MADREIRAHIVVTEKGEFAHDCRSGQHISSQDSISAITVPLDLTSLPPNIAVHFAHCAATWVLMKLELEAHSLPHRDQDCAQSADKCPVCPATALWAYGVQCIPIFVVDES